ncbi:HD-GYP domain-containing protein [Abyssisolibacter fermentans]|uniref:HD-GYP domain-containing protein n=1 Tax=Abyssisolibacter fermentans TaxID=1766203 RepID=UPI00083281FA|nr:HD-GYP domain-containing protein [Abyssisolibacter fermentans]
MRFLPIVYAKDNSILGKHVYDNEGRILLKKGATLTPKIKKRIKQIGIHSVYVLDEYSDEELKDVIRPELRNQALSSIKSTFNHFRQYNNKQNNSILNSSVKNRFNNERRQHINNLSKISEEILDEILSNKDILINLVDIKSNDAYTLQHSINVAVLSLILGISLNLNKSDLRDLCLGAILHDIGKTMIPKEILQKNGPLTKEEFDIVKTHPQIGYDYLKDCSNISGKARIIALHHHEKYDGTGYPQSLVRNDINKLARIVTIADVYDALTSDRPYRLAMPPNAAIEYLMAGGGTSFDFDMVKIFISKIIPYPIGSLVRLSNGKIATIKNIHERFPLRPFVAVVWGGPKQDIDLMKETNIVIKNIEYQIPEE